jgi:hypothetical protein
MIGRSGMMSKRRELVKKKKSLNYRGFGEIAGQGRYSRFYMEAGVFNSRAFQVFPTPKEMRNSHMNFIQ